MFSTRINHLNPLIYLVNELINYNLWNFRKLMRIQSQYEDMCSKGLNYVFL